MRCQKKIFLSNPCTAEQYYTVSLFLLGAAYSKITTMTRYYAHTACILCSIAILAGIVMPAYATEPSVRITEIMYNAEGADEGKEYVEIINAGPGSVDMTTVRFFERDDRQSGRKISQYRGSATLPPGGIAVIVSKPEAFLENYVFNGTILDTSIFSLLNNGSTVSLWQSDRLLHRVSYTKDDGAWGDGNSLHIAQNDIISPGSPTPGVVRDVTVDTGTANTGTNRTDDTERETNETVSNEAAEIAEREPNETPSNEITETEEKQEEPPPVIETTIIPNPEKVFIASTAEFSVMRTENGKNKKTLHGLWNFGDGSFRYGDTVEHVYLHPGVYIIVFQELHEDGEAGAVLQQEIEVLFPQVSIERVDDAFVRLHNRHSFTLDIAGWRIESGGSVFEFPDNSLVPAAGSTIIPFSMNTGYPLFFITAGGGQFSGEPQKQKNIQQDEPKTESAEEKESEEEDATTAQPVIADKKDDRSAKKPNIDTENAVVYREEKEMETADKKMVIVWVVLFVSILAVALAPILLARNERKKHLHDKK